VLSCNDGTERRKLWVNRGSVKSSLLRNGLENKYTYYRRNNKLASLEQLRYYSDCSLYAQLKNTRNTGSREQKHIDWNKQID
jgi:hypothetical protein